MKGVSDFVSSWHRYMRSSLT